MTLKRSTFLLYLVMVIIAIQSCSKHYFRSNYQDANRLLYESDSIKTKLFLKAHLKNGDICILKDNWAVDTISNVLSGRGTRFDFNRSKVSDGEMSIPIREVDHFSLQYAKGEPYWATIPVAAALPFIHGAYSIISVPVHLIVTVSVTSAGKSSFSYSEKDMTNDKMSMFARFPQGIPAHIDPSSIK